MSSLQLIDKNGALVRTVELRNGIVALSIMDDCIAMTINDAGGNVGLRISVPEMIYAVGVDGLASLGLQQLSLLAMTLRKAETWPAMHRVMSTVKSLELHPSVTGVGIRWTTPQDRLVQTANSFRKIVYEQWQNMHAEIVDIVIALGPVKLPAYVVLWTVDWLPGMMSHNELRKITLIANVIKSRANVLAKRR
jgi:hypothetical protein